MTMFRKLIKSKVAANAANAIVGDTKDNVTAAGTNQVTAYRIVSDTTVFSSVSAGTGAILPVSTAVNDVIYVINTASNTLKLYPALGETINNGAVNAEFEVIAGACVKLLKTAETKWWTVAHVGGNTASTTALGFPGTWTTSVGNGAVTITDKINLSILAASTAANLYPDTNNPKAQQDISGYINDDCNFTVVARVVSATLHADSRLSMSIGDASNASGMIVFLDATGSLGLGPWDNSGDAGSAAAACPLDGTGWIRIVCRGGLVSAGCGTGTTASPPTAWHTIRPGRPTGSAPFAKLTMYMSKWAGADTSGAFDNVQITVL